MLPPVHSGFEQELKLPEPEPKNNLWFWIWEQIQKKNSFFPFDTGNIFILEKKWQSETLTWYQFRQKNSKAQQKPNNCEEESKLES